MLLTLVILTGCLEPLDTSNKTINFDQTQVAVPICDVHYNFIMAGPGFVESGFTDGQQYVVITPRVPDDLIKLTREECSIGKYASLVKLAKSTDRPTPGSVWNNTDYDYWISDGRPGFPVELDKRVDDAFERMTNGLAQYQIDYISGCPDRECKEKAYELFDRESQLKDLNQAIISFQEEVNYRGLNCDKFALGQVYNETRSPIRLRGKKCNVVIQ